jgi:hypothetical protein
MRSCTEFRVTFFRHVGLHKTSKIVLNFIFACSAGDLVPNRIRELNGLEYCVSALVRCRDISACMGSSICIDGVQMATM